LTTFSHQSIDESSARVTVVGEFTEHTDFSEVLELSSLRLVFDLSGVSRINSCGVREWIRLMDALRGRTIELHKCSVPFVAQLNMIVNFVGEAKVCSFFAPYLCVECDKERLRLVERERALELPEFMACPECGAAMEFDDLKEVYLTFVTRR
jgi:anti-anti-sigma regulatory factor/DNA-directed RNA polymerase subunit RPC12/RpoP